MGPEIRRLNRSQKALRRRRRDREMIGDTLKLPDLPSVPGFRYWRQQARTNVSALAQRNPDRLYGWMLVVDDQSYDELNDASEFRQAEMTLSSTLRDLIAKAKGTWVTDLYNKRRNSTRVATRTGATYS